MWDIGFQYFAITNNAAVNNLCMCIFVLLGMYLQGEILEVRSLDEKVNADVVLLGIATFLSIRVAPVFIPTRNKSASSP